MTVSRVRTPTAWKARGFTDLAAGAIVNARDALVYGTYQPSDTTAGVIDRATWDGDEWNSPSVDNLTLSSSGGIVENKIVYGDLKPPTNGAYWEFRNCKLVGGNHTPANTSAILTCYSARTGTDATTYTDVGRIKALDCDIIPRKPSWNRDGAVGSTYTLERSRLSGGLVDGAGVYNQPARGQYSNVKILGCWMDDTGYYAPDTQNGHSDGTHNDLIQCQGGGNIQIIGNWLDHRHTDDGYLPGSDPYEMYPWLPEGGWGAGACVLLQNNTGVANYTTSNALVRDNWMRGGKWHMVYHANTAATVSNNHHYYDVAKRPSGAAGSNYQGYHAWVSDPASSNVVGLQNGTLTNTFIDGPRAGLPLAEPKINGLILGAGY